MAPRKDEIVILVNFGVQISFEIRGTVTVYVIVRIRTRNLKGTKNSNKNFEKK